MFLHLSSAIGSLIYFVAVSVDHFFLIPLYDMVEKTLVMAWFVTADLFFACCCHGVSGALHNRCGLV